MKKTIPAEVLEHARRLGLGYVRYEGEFEGAEVYSEYGNFDKDGNINPTGLPFFILFKDGKTELVDGLDALDLLGRFH